jgi:two-component system alkaline phosphatase synthesis response regulator PhoP
MIAVSLETQGTKAGSAKILVAEDEKDIRELVSFTLRYAGYDVWTADDGIEAVEIAQEIIPDLILMDVRMPKMTGYEACEVMKQMDTLKDIPIVFLSAKGQETEIQQGLAAGAIAYILKPFAPADLTLRVEELLATVAGEE